MFLAGDDEMSKKPAATRKPAAKKKAPVLADHDDNSMDGEYTYTNPSVARSTSVAITKSNSNVTPVTSTNTYTVQPKDSGFSYSYVKDEKNLVEVDIHLWGNITQKTYRVEVSRCGMYLMWQRATPPTYFHDVLGNDTALRLNASDAVALQTTVWGLRTRFGSDGLKHHFGDEWQYFKLPQECHRKIHNSIICRDDGDIVRGNQQYNCIVRIFLLAKDQYKAEKENMVQEVYFGGGGGAGGGGGCGGGGGGSRKYKSVTTMRIATTHLCRSLGRARRVVLLLVRSALPAMSLVPLLLLLVIPSAKSSRSMLLAMESRRRTAMLLRLRFLIRTMMHPITNE